MRDFDNSRLNRSIALHDGNSRQQLVLRDILFIQADHIYVRIYLADGQRVLHRKSLRELQRFLPAPFFLQIHRSHIVNLTWIGEWDSQEIELAGHRLSISRARKKEVQKELSTFFSRPQR